MIRALVFDLDGTLYDCEALLERQREVAIEALQDHLRCSRQEAISALATARASLRRSLGFEPTTTAAAVAAGMLIEKYLEECGRRYDASEFLGRDNCLVSVLTRLRDQYKTGLLSNNNRVQVDSMLKALGVLELFDASLTLTETRIIKPDARLYRQMSDLLDVAPQHCVAIGDREHVDLVPAAEIGMRTILVSSVRQVYDLDSTLAAFRRRD